MKTAVFHSVAAFSAVHGAIWAWPNFTPDEIACKDGSIMIDTDALNRLQALRDEIGVPFVIHSAYRSPAHNAAVGGARHSYHMLAEAFDIRMEGHDPHEFEAAARRHGFHGIGHYAKSETPFLHIDTRDEAEAAQWGDKFPYGEDDPAPAPPLAEAPAPDTRKAGRVRVGGFWRFIQKGGLS